MLGSDGKAACRGRRVWPPAGKRACEPAVPPGFPRPHPLPHTHTHTRAKHAVFYLLRDARREGRAPAMARLEAERRGLQVSP